MSNSQRPKPDPLAPPSFELPDLELEPMPPVARQPSTASALPLGDTPQLSFEEPDSFELERTAQPNSWLSGEGRTAWPTGRALSAARLKLDPVEIAILANYGDVPQAVQLTPAYAYRVFTRQRELKRQLIPITAECQRGQSEREAMLAEMARTVRPAAENNRAALADLGRALLAAGSLEISEAWLERVRRVCQHADKLSIRREMQVRAIDAYDQPRARQGVQLACTVIGLFGLLIVFKLIF